MTEYPIGNAHIGAFTEHIHNVRTRFTQQKTEQHRYQHAEGENVQGRI